MTLHPYATEDHALIQDLMMTKVVFLLASEAEPQEWHHEINEMQRISGETWGRQNASLLDYTVGRFIVAAYRDTGQHTLAAENPTEVLPSYLISIQNGTHMDAMAVRETLNDSGAENASSLLPSTAQLLSILLPLSKQVRLKNVILALPLEYAPSSHSS